MATSCDLRQVVTSWSQRHASGVAFGLLGELRRHNDVNNSKITKMTIVIIFVIIIGSMIYIPIAIIS